MEMFQIGIMMSGAPLSGDFGGGASPRAHVQVEVRVEVVI
jgi:hypothetical protein